MPGGGGVLLCGFRPNLPGPTLLLQKQFSCGCVFVEDVRVFMRIKHQVDINATETAKAN